MDKSARKTFYEELHELRQRFDMMSPELEVTVRDAELQVEGHIVVWNTAISRDGPLPYCAKGGTRIRPGLTQAEVRMLAKNMAIKNAAAGLPLGGCKSGLNADPNFDYFEFQYKRFVELCKPFTYENGGPFGGFGFDIGGAPEHAIWACDALNSTRSFTGKPIELGGTDYDREGIAGLGVAESAAHALKLRGTLIKGKPYSVHGVGAMGAAVIRYFSELGASLYCLGDPKYQGTWAFPHGVSEALLKALGGNRQEEAMSLILDEGTHVSDDPNKALFCKCDILFPCAMQHAITKENAHLLKVNTIVEGANNPCEQDAYPEIYAHNIDVIPDFIANVGGVIAAYVELTSNVSNKENIRSHAKVHEAKNFTRKTIQRNIAKLLDTARKNQVPLRDAGHYIALNAIFQHEAP